MYAFVRGMSWFVRGMSWFIRGKKILRHDLYGVKNVMSWFIRGMSWSIRVYLRKNRKIKCQNRKKKKKFVRITKKSEKKRRIREPVIEKIYLQESHASVVLKLTGLCLPLFLYKYTIIYIFLVLAWKLM